MNFFNELLDEHRLNKHDGRPLWNYNLSTNQFHELQGHLKKSTLSEIDDKDATLYYSEWWKRCYNGGRTSISEIYKSISNTQFNEKEFFTQAKNGAIKLGIKWIKVQNTLKLRTLFLQGGIPINHIKNHQTSYRLFLERILDLQPSSIDDFQYDANITKLLPTASQNEIIYESCFEIVRAILNDDEQYLSIFDNDDDLKNISGTLRERKKNLISKTRKVLIKPLWILNIDESNSASISLRLSAPNFITQEDFSNLLLVSDTYDYEYRLFINDTLVCKFKQASNNGYKTIFLNQQINWNQLDFIPKVLLIDTKGNRIDNNNLISFFPDISLPTLWTRFTANQWVLSKSKNIVQEECLALIDLNAFIQNEECNIISKSEIILNSNSLNAICFSGTLNVLFQDKSYCFRTNITHFDWTIIGQKIGWINKSNIPIVKNFPTVVAYNLQGELLKNIELYWKRYGGTTWNTRDVVLTPGLIEIKITIDDIEETDYFFNIGRLNVKINSHDLNHATFNVEGNNFNFKINESEYYNLSQIDENKLSIKLTDNSKIPNSIKATIAINGQAKGVLLEILPPFCGVALINNQNEVIPDNSKLFIQKINSFRIMSNEQDVVIKLYNNKRRNIILSLPISHNFSVAQLRDHFSRLFMLSDVIDKEGFVWLEIYQNTTSGGNVKLKSYQIMHYNGEATLLAESGSTSIQITQNNECQLLAVPLDCNLEDIELNTLKKDGSIYQINENELCNKYIVLNIDDENEFKILPFFVSTNPDNVLTDDEDRLNRITDFKEQLSSSNNCKDLIWQKALAYYKICVSSNLPFSTFDILRVMSCSSNLATKAFMFFNCYDDISYFSDENIERFEQEIGFSFHWINKNDWYNAMTWIGGDDNLELFPALITKLKGYFNSLYPIDNFSLIFSFINGNSIPRKEIAIQQEILNIRQILGERVLQELPRKYPRISSEHRHILPVPENAQNIEVLLISPLAVALSIAGKSDNIWRDDYEFIRRNIKYCQDINPEWYSKAICYSLSRIN